MAGKDASITVRILGDASGAKGAADETEVKYGGLSGKMTGFMAGIGAAAGGMAKDMAGSLISAAGDWVNLAKEAEVASKKSDIVFGDSSAGVKLWADGINESLGLSDEKVVGLTASMGDLLVPLGFTRDEAAKMSEKAIELSGALSAWSGGTTSAAEVSDILTKAMLGETDGLKSLGISISADEVARKQAQMAAEGQTFATDAQAKAAATQALILEKSTDAQTAWSNGTMDSVKNQNKMSASFEDAKVALGKGLLPILTAATTFIVDKVIPGVTALIAYFQDNVLPVIKTVVEGIANVIGAAVGWIKEHWDQITAVIQTAVDIISGIITTVIDVIMAAWNLFGDDLIAAFELAWNYISGAFQVIVDLIVGIFDTFKALFTGDWQGLWDGIKEIVTAIWDGIKLVIQTAIDSVLLIIQTAWDAIKAAAELAWDAIKAAILFVWEALKLYIETEIALIKAIITGVWDALKAATSLVWDGIKTAITAVWDAIKTAASATWDAIKAAIMLPIDALTALIQGVWDGIKTAASTAWSALSTAAGTAWDLIKAAVMAPINLITGLIGSVWDGIVTTITGLPTRIASAASSMWDGIKDAFKKVLNFIIDLWNGLDFTFHIPEITIPTPPGMDDWHVGGGEFTFGLPDIPRLHTGGIVQGVIGSDQIAILQAGEGVFTREQMAAMGGEGRTINFMPGAHVYNDVDMDAAYRLLNFQMAAA